MVQFIDHLTLDAPSLTKDGFLAVRAKAAKVGVYQYAGIEIDPTNAHGLRDQATVNVLRDAETVFSDAAVRSFIGKPVTNDHPTVPVTAANWRDYARGTIMGALRDGDYLAFDLTLMDAATIADVSAGKRELSNGYSATLQFGDFKAPDGTACQARQSAITDGNHVALVDKGRAGPECAIKDGEKFAACDAVSFTTKEGRVSKIITVDGLPVDLADVAAVEALLAKKDAAIASVTDALAIERGSNAALRSQLDAANAAAEPAAIDKRVADRSALVALAKGAFPAVVTDGKSDDEVRAAVVIAKLGDKAPTDAGMIAGAFAVLTADVKATAEVVNIAPARVADSASVRDTVRAARYA